MGLKNSKFAQGVMQRLPAILTGLGIGSMLTGTVVAVGVTPAAMRSIEEKKRETGKDVLNFQELVEATWKYYIWAAAAELAGASFLIGAQAENMKRQAALMTAIDVANTGLQEAQVYRRYVAAKLGDNKEQEIYNQAAQAAAQEQVNRNPPPASMTQDIVEGQAPKPICYDAHFGRYIYLTYEEAKAAVNQLNYEINNGLNGYVSLNDFYYKVGAASVDCGNRLGWSTETGLIAIPDKRDIQYTGTPNGTPCWVLKFTNPPQYDYQYFRKH